MSSRPSNPPHQAHGPQCEERKMHATGYAWEVKCYGSQRYSVRHRRESGDWETPSNGGWSGRTGAEHALLSSGVTEATSREMLKLASPGKTVRLSNCDEIEVLNLSV